MDVWLKTLVAAACCVTIAAGALYIVSVFTGWPSSAFQAVADRRLLEDAKRAACEGVIDAYDHGRFYAGIDDDKAKCLAQYADLKPKS